MCDTLLSQVHWNQTLDKGRGPCAADCIDKQDHTTGETITNATICYPSRREVTELSVTTKTLTLDGPVALVQGGDGPAFIMRHPIFVNTTGEDYNSTFDRPYDVTDCPDACFDATTGMRYWGMSDSLLRFHRCERANATRHVPCIFRVAISHLCGQSTPAAVSAQSSGVSEGSYALRGDAVVTRTG
jgi:hypothetical protein